MQVVSRSTKRNSAEDRTRRYPAAVETSARLELAQLIADELISHPEAVVGVALFGSVARHEDSDASDIDLLVLVGRPAIGARTLRTFLPSNVSTQRVSLACYTESMLREGMRTHASLALHLKLEAAILADTGGRLSTIIHTPIDLHQAADAEIAALRSSLERLRELRQYNGDYLFLLSRVYRISRSLVYAFLARLDIAEFDTATAFAVLSEHRQELAPYLQALERLRPFSDLTSEVPSSELPFSREAHGAAAYALQAALKLATA